MHVWISNHTTISELVNNSTPPPYPWNIVIQGVHKQIEQASDFLQSSKHTTINELANKSAPSVDPWVIVIYIAHKLTKDASDFL